MLIETGRSLSGFGNPMTSDEWAAAMLAVDGTNPNQAQVGANVNAVANAYASTGGGEAFLQRLGYPTGMSTLQKGVAIGGIGAAVVGLGLFLTKNKKTGTTLGLLGLAGIGGSVLMKKMNIGG